MISPLYCWKFEEGQTLDMPAQDCRIKGRETKKAVNMIRILLTDNPCIKMMTFH